VEAVASLQDAEAVMVAGAEVVAEAVEMVAEVDEEVAGEEAVVEA
jgi:hypothetical protein